jgi:hypothetical protein
MPKECLEGVALIVEVVVGFAGGSVVLRRIPAEKTGAAAKVLARSVQFLEYLGFLTSIKGFTEKLPGALCASENPIDFPKLPLRTGRAITFANEQGAALSTQTWPLNSAYLAFATTAPAAPPA